MDEQTIIVKEVEKRKHDSVKVVEAKRFKKHESNEDSLFEDGSKGGSAMEGAAKRGSLKQNTSKAATDKQKKVEVFPLLALPRELRDKVYELAVRRDIQCIEFENASHACREYQQPALCMVSKQIRTEVLPVFYGSNKFEGVVFGIRDCRPLASTISAWLNAIGHLNCSLIKTFVVKVFDSKATRSPSLTPKEQQLANTWRNEIHATLGSAVSAFKFGYQIEFQWEPKENINSWIAEGGLEAALFGNDLDADLEAFWEAEDQDYWRSIEGLDEEDDDDEDVDEDVDTEDVSEGDPEAVSEEDSEEDIEEDDEEKSEEEDLEEHLS